MNFQEMTADKLAKYLNKNGETTNWECKSSDVLKDFRKHIPRQISAFLNTEGGYLVIGLKEIDAPEKFKIDPCERMRGTEPMKEYLEKMVSNSVVPPIQRFTVYEVPIENDLDHFIYVIRVDPTLTVPHQTNDTKREYLWRNKSATESAPHSHLEQLWNRTTKSAVEVVEIGFKTHLSPIGKHLRPELKSDYFSITVRVCIKNRSLQFATEIGLYFTLLSTDWLLENATDRNDISEACIRKEGGLMPNEATWIEVPLLTLLPEEKLRPSDLVKLLQARCVAVAFEVRPVSQNYIGTTRHYPEGKEWQAWFNEKCQEDVDKIERLKERMKNALKTFEKDFTESPPVIPRHPDW